MLQQASLHKITLPTECLKRLRSFGVDSFAPLYREDDSKRLLKSKIYETYFLTGTVRNAQETQRISKRYGIFDNLKQSHGQDKVLEEG
jgi:hypothetical protein